MARRLVLVKGLPGACKTTVADGLADAQRAEPLALSPVIRVDTTRPVDLARLAQDVRSAACRDAIHDSAST